MPKRRVVKKWVNRYITPLTKDLPKTKSYSFILVDPADPNNIDKMVTAYKGTRSTTICNGIRLREGSTLPKTQDILKEIKKSAETLKYMLSIPELYPRPHFRSWKAHKTGGFLLRIIAYKNWPEGYIKATKEQEDIFYGRSSETYTDDLALSPVYRHNHR